MPRRPDALYAGTGRYVIAVDAATGTERWRTKLPSIHGAVVSLMLNADKLYVGHGGELHCLDPETGAVRWTNKLPKTGYNPVMMALPGAVASIGAAMAASHMAAQAAVAAAAAASAAASAAS